VFGSVRTTDDAKAAQAEFGDSFTPLLFDVTDASAIARAKEFVRDAVGDAGLGGMVNNAGICVSGPLLHVPMTEVRHQLEVNVLGGLQVFRSFLPLLGAVRPCPHAPGRIVQHELHQRPHCHAVRRTLCGLQARTRGPL
jgi:NAD(P)-dependent dehydrogenase (short-subunit alcohol dehydrogenase family)